MSGAVLRLPVGTAQALHMRSRATPAPPCCTVTLPHAGSLRRKFGFYEDNRRIKTKREFLNEKLTELSVQKLETTDMYTISMTLHWREFDSAIQQNPLI